MISHNVSVWGGGGNFPASVLAGFSRPGFIILNPGARLHKSHLQERLLGARFPSS